MLKEIDLPEDEEAIIRYIEHEFSREGRSLAIFSCTADNYFRAYPLSVSVHSRIHIGKTPYVRPLANILDAYGAYGVALVDKQGGRFFYFHMGELVEQEGVLGEEVHKVRGVDGSENMVKRNIKESAEFAMTFFNEKKVRRVLIGGTDENVAQFQKNLSKTWQSLVVGTLSLGMTANQQDVLTEAIKVGSAAEEKREAGLVRQMIATVAKHSNGVLGLRDTLRAAQEGRVQTLLVDTNFHASGYKCDGCEHLTAENLETCPFCGEGFSEIPDAAEMAVRRVMLDGGVVEIVRDNAEMADAGIGGLLRY
jgi:stalled ribosome rescue protein Dom34